MAAAPLTSKSAELNYRNGNGAHTTQPVSGPDEEPKATMRDPKSAAPIPPTGRAQAARKRYSLEEKRRILRLADACTERGQIGALRRREGIYYATLRLFMQPRDNGGRDTPATTAKKSRPQETQALHKQIEQLIQQNQRLTNRLEKAEIVIEFQKKRSQLWQSPEPRLD
jgi:transposase-like protein